MLQPTPKIVKILQPRIRIVNMQIMFGNVQWKTRTINLLPMCEDNCSTTIYYNQILAKHLQQLIGMSFIILESWSCANIFHVMLLDWHVFYCFTVSESIISEHSIIVTLGDCQAIYCFRIVWSSAQWDIRTFWTPEGTPDSKLCRLL